MGKIAIYSRKSRYTGKGESIANQIELCRQYIEMHFGEAECIVYEDEGFSGKNTHRPEFQAMIADIERGQIDRIVCYRLDRISRNMSDFVKLIDYLNEKRVQFTSVNEQFDTTVPMGKAMMYISSIFSQLERETIAERIRDNLMELAKTGRWLGGIPPTGYRSLEVKTAGINGRIKRAHRLEILEDEADIVRLIFDKYLELKSLTGLESLLISREIKSRGNNFFSRVTLKGILANPVYAVADDDSFEYFKGYEIFSGKNEFDGVHGIIAYNKTTQTKKKTSINPMENWIIAVGEHNGIISGSDWVEVQRLLKANAQKLYRQPRVSKALLGGIIYCSCGSPVGAKQGRNGAYCYACRMKLRSKHSQCRVENLDGRKLDNYIIEMIKGLECDKISLIRELEKGKRRLRGGNRGEITLLRKRLSNNRNEINALVSKLVDAGRGAEKYIIERINTLDAENSTIERKISEQESKEAERKTAISEIEGFKKKVMCFSDCVENMSCDEKRGAIRTLIKKILWDGINIQITLATDDIITVPWNNRPEEKHGDETWEKLKYWRGKRGYLQREVAEGVGITRTMYTSYEKRDGFCPAKTLKKIADFLQVDFCELAEDYHYFQLAEDQAERVKAARERLGLNKREFADMLNVDRTTIQRWEKGKGEMSRKEYKKIRMVTEI